MRGNAVERLRIGIGRLPVQRWQSFGKIDRVLAAAASDFEAEAVRRQDAPQDFEDRLAVARDVWTILARVGR